jgi:hypothetical protein
MKRTVVVLLILAPLLRAEGAGGDGLPMVSFSVFVGPNWSKYTRTPDIATIPEISFRLASDRGGLIGVSWQYRLGERFILDAALQISDRGTTLKWYENGVFQGRWTYNFLMFSSCFGLLYRPFHGATPYLAAGTLVSYVDEHTLIDQVDPEGPVEIGLNGDTGEFDMGVFAGAGFEIPFKGKRWVPFVEVSYHIGLINVSEGTGFLESYPVIRTRALAVVAGVRFRSKRAGSGP